MAWLSALVRKVKGQEKDEYGEYKGPRPQNWYHIVEVYIRVPSRTTKISYCDPPMLSALHQTYLVNWNKDMKPHIQFVDLNGFPGIRMDEGLKGYRGLLGAEREVLAELRSTKLKAVPSEIMLSLRWPGYEHVNYRRMIPMIRRDGSELTPMGQLLICVCDSFRRFIEKHSEKYDPNCRHGQRLGPHGLKLEDLVPRELHTSDKGFTWVAEVAYLKSAVTRAKEHE